MGEALFVGVNLPFVAKLAMLLLLSFVIHRYQILCDYYLLVPVEIVQDPMETTHFAGGSVSLTCSASGIPSPAFVWFKDGQQMFEGGRVTILSTTLTDTPNKVVVQSTLSFMNLMLSDDANYFCEASNPGAYGTTFVARSDTARLIVEREHDYFYSFGSL